MKINSGNLPLNSLQGDILVVGIFEDLNYSKDPLEEINSLLNNFIADEIINRDKYKAKLGCVQLIPTFGKMPIRKIALLGLGQREKFDVIALRKAFSQLVKACKKLNPDKVFTVLPGAGNLKENIGLIAQVIVEGALLGYYTFDKYKSKKENNTNDENAKQIKELVIITPDANSLNEINNGIEKGKIIAEATCFSRDMVSEPPSYMTPTKIAELAISIGLDCIVYDKTQIEEMKMNSFLGVSKGSDEPPKFIHLTYKPEGEICKKVAIVGKGLTFDSGGLDLKTAAGMLDMKMDMSGAAAVLGIMRAIKELKPNIEVHGIIAACENMPDGKSYKPGDVLVAKNGKTIEVNNTDAEGRLVLADALSYAVDLKPDEIFDLATLTGAVIIALGTRCAGIMTNKQELLDNFINKSKLSGEKVWQLPLLEEYKELLKSDIADIRNSGNREAGSSFGGIFLQEFVSDLPWVHIDIAGTAWSEKDKFETPKGATGYGVRSLIYYLMNN